MAGSVKKAPKATLKSIRLKKVHFNQPIDDPRKGNVNVESTVKIINFDETNKTFVGLLIIKIGGTPNEDSDPSFDAITEWNGLFELNRKSNEEAVVENVEHYLNHVYPVARTFIVDTLFKMGITLNQLPWEINPK